MTTGVQHGLKTPPLLLSAPQAAAFVGVSRSRWFELQAQGAIPPAVRPGGGRRMWRRQDIERWVALGCPSGERFAALRK